MELDGWRAVSVLVVIVHHLGAQHQGFVSRFPFLAIRINYCGPLAVKIFFVISGFVICRLLIREESRYGSVSLKGFYYRRIFRILPPFYIYLGSLFLLLSLGLIRESQQAILSSGMFLCDFRTAPKSWFVDHTLSLAVEEQFYLVFPCLFVLMPSRLRARVCLAAFVLLVAWNVAAAYSGWNSLVLVTARAGFASIAWGVLMAVHEDRARSVAKNVPAFAVGLIAFTLLLRPVGPLGWRAALYETLLVPVGIGVLLLFSLERGPQLRIFLCSKPMQAIGLTSYGIYLWQQLFTAPIRGNFPSESRIISLLLPVLCLIVPLSYLLVEKPAMRYGKFLSQRTRNGSLEINTPV